MSAHSTRHKRKDSNATSHRSTLSMDKIEIKVNIYDLLPPGKVSSLFWMCGVGLLHTGVVINDREYAFGGHDRRGVTGVYWTKPRQEPPGGLFRTEFIQGFTFHSTTEINDILREATEEFLGPTYNVLTRNCNHFTDYVCFKLTGQHTPSWINRAARIGVALPCVVPTAWVEPPECEEEAMLRPEEMGRGRVGSPMSGYDEEENERRREASDRWTDDYDSEEEAAARLARDDMGRSRKTRDEDGHLLPRSERADLRTVL